MNANSQSDDSDRALTEAHKDMIKGTIALPIEGCKSMATGCATVAGLYGATLVFANQGKLAAADAWEAAVLILPFLLFAVAGFLFARGFLPQRRLSELLKDSSAVDHKSRVVEREQYIRDKVVQGSAVFWLALAWAFIAVVAVRIDVKEGPNNGVQATCEDARA